ncbi:aldo/keto reductase [Pseudalkalibacillus hwajinpoensis]|uniref:aldo/keto reductase n=1 Tax=Guptibacillus hwajinpoensis TaxID=208199 RepID=UPI00325B5A9C
MCRFSSDAKGVRLRQTVEKITSEIKAEGIDQIVYGWLLNHPANIMPIVGSGKPERNDSATDALSYRLTRDKWFEI